MRNFFVFTLLCFVWASCVGMTPDEAKVIYEFRNCEVQYTECGKVCYDCEKFCPNNDGVNEPVDPEVFLHYGEFKDQLAIQPQPTPLDCPGETPIDPNFDGATQSANGEVHLFATEFKTNTPNSTHGWVASGGFMVAEPDIGTRDTTEFDVELTYNIRFSKEGTHYVWFQGEFVTASSDSLHYGLNGVRITDVTFLNKTWSNEQQSNLGRATISVTPGDYVFNVYMREDGSKFQKIVIVTDQTFTP